MSENTQPIFSIEKLYVKDMSLEVPAAPRAFLEREAPKVNVQLRTDGKNVEDGIFEVTLTVSVSAEAGETKTLFLVEVVQAGIFQIRNVPESELQPILLIGCPNILFPYAREAVSDAVTRAGFQPIVLSPVNFEALYQQGRKEVGQTTEATQ